MLIAVPKEIKPGETRVAATPDIVQKYKFMGEPKIQTIPLSLHPFSAQ